MTKGEGLAKTRVALQKSGFARSSQGGESSNLSEIKSKLVGIKKTAAAARRYAVGADADNFGDIFDEAEDALRLCEEE